MSVMPDIVEFLTARLDETQVDAEAAHAGPWVADLDDEVDENVTDMSGQIVAWVRARPATAATRAHIARHDPARVLREVKAKRALMALHGLETLSHQPAQYELPDGFAGEFVGYCQLCSDLDYPEGLATYYEPWPCPSTRILASVYAEHPDYKQAWGPDA